MTDRQIVSEKKAEPIYILLAVICFICASVFTSDAQEIDILLKGGHVIDPKNEINSPMDVAIIAGKISQVAVNIPSTEAKKIVDVSGMYVVPGLIDIHTHVFWGTDLEGTYKNGPNGVAPDGFTLRNGVTTIVDAGSSGWRSFPVLKKQTIDISQTRVLAMLNIVGDGMRKGIYEQNVSDMDPLMAANSARQYRDHIVGIKVAHFASPSFVAVDRGVEAAELAGLPLMVDFGGTKQLLSPDSQELSIEELFMEHLRPGDIFTHTYALTAGREPIVDEDDKVKPFVFKARERGIIFDAGYGGGSFKFSQAIPASKADFYPHTIGTDLHTNSMNNGMRDMLNLMSIFLALDMDLPSVIKASTWSPAKAIKREELGHLSPGSIADVAILNMHSGKFGFYDPIKYKIEGKQRLECEMTIIGGKVVYDRNGMSIPLGVNN